ncbi:hypothetical protein J4219_07260 [Candidatus Woesearchaeota archaeon]|nr:hypothetical protein [Candidatus Woesearchaeota archaeon]
MGGLGERTNNRNHNRAVRGYSSSSQRNVIRSSMIIREAIDLLAQFGGVFAEKKGEGYLSGTSFVSGELRVQKAHLGETVMYSVWYGGLGEISTEPVYVFVQTPNVSQILRFISGEWEKQLEKEFKKKSLALDSGELVAKLV